MKGLQLKRILVIPALLVLAACTGSGTASDLAITTNFSPNPPKQGSEEIVVTLKDASGNPVTGASVKITSTMPSMSMTGPRADAKDNGDGTYTANLVLQYATRWSFDVSAAANGKTTTAEVTQDVK